MGISNEPRGVPRADRVTQVSFFPPYFQTGYDLKPAVKRSQVNQPPAYAAMTLQALSSTPRWALLRAHLLSA